jgi:hypothetical protein
VISEVPTAASALRANVISQPAFYVDGNTPEVFIGVREGARSQE